MHKINLGLSGKEEALAIKSIKKDLKRRSEILDKIIAIISFIENEQYLFDLIESLDKKEVDVSVEVL